MRGALRERGGVAGAALTPVPDLPPLAVIGIGAFFGILGQQHSNCSRCRW
ncbi:phage holin family protein [Burkholderia multivorans]|nr:phage holin family protein [Burkholderia multivorans]